ncbi:MAG: MBL fold metallo-hydrolase [Eubacteriales bacterium]|nr:MBL fold metallo-hydrolase [Eubacteriales bacterium]
MRLTFLQHSGFLLETESWYLIFDLCRSEEALRKNEPICVQNQAQHPAEHTGMLPMLTGEKPIAVFVSHSHYDHFDEAIFGLSDQYGKERVHYVLSSDIDDIDDIAERLSGKLCFMGPGEARKLNPGELGIRTLRSNDAGVAYLVETDGKLIYHAGDLQYWDWPGEPEEDNLHYRDTYIEEIGKLSRLLKGREVFLSMLVLDGRQEQSAYLGIDWFLCHIRTKYAVPMHSFGHYEINSAYAVHFAALKEAGKLPGGSEGARYLPITHAGETFILDEDT